MAGSRDTTGWKLSGEIRYCKKWGAGLWPRRQPIGIRYTRKWGAVTKQGIRHTHTHTQIRHNFISWQEYDAWFKGQRSDLGQLFLQCFGGGSKGLTAKLRYSHESHTNKTFLINITQGVPASSRSSTRSSLVELRRASTSLLSKPRRQLGYPFLGGNQEKFPGNS
jgi:hypothetical protein